MASMLSGCDAPVGWQQLAELVGTLRSAFGTDGALETITAMVETAPQDGNLRAWQGQILVAAGRLPEAARALAAAVALGTEVEAIGLLADAVFPGPHYRDYLRELHRWLQPAIYLEIGVFTGDTLALAQPGTQAIGIDPAPRPQAGRRYLADTRIHRMTSDAYFAAVPVSATVGAAVDLAFIDGLHLYEQALRDFINVERSCHAGSVVVLHDTLPVAVPAAARQRSTNFWCGDVWKMLPCLRRYRPDLQLLTVPTHPTGLTLVRGLDCRSRVLDECFEQAVAEYFDAPLPAASMPPAYVGDIANDPEQVRRWLTPRPACA